MEVIKNEVDEVIELVVDKEGPKSGRGKSGFFALVTHCDMAPAEMVKVYKSRDLVEKGFSVSARYVIARTCVLKPTQYLPYMDIYLFLYCGRFLRVVGLSTRLVNCPTR